jgi:glucose/arabinose dehydrogenase
MACSFQRTDLFEVNLANSVPKILKPSGTTFAKTVRGLWSNAAVRCQTRGNVVKQHGFQTDSLRVCWSMVGCGWVLALASCSEVTTVLSPLQGMGPNPVLPPPEYSALPTVNIAPAVGWPENTKPQPAPNLSVVAFAQGLDHPRWIYALPNGDVLVAETNAPPKPDPAPTVPAWFKKQAMKWFMGRAGATVPSANRITLLRDGNGDGVADQKFVLLKDLNSPFGMALIGNSLYVANTDAVMRFPYATGDTKITAPGVKLLDLPAGSINHHWTKNVLASFDGSKLFVTVGSNSNVAERGMQVEQGRAAIWQVDTDTGAHRLFATGLRNPNGLAWEVVSEALWTVVNERDELGNDLVPDYLTSVRDGAFYGWPYSYFGQNVDVRVKPQRPDLVATAVVPDYAVGSHTAPLGLTSSVGSRLPKPFVHGMFIGQHGSWNRRPHSGYKVVFVPFEGGKPVDTPPVDVLTGFLSPQGQAWGRPVGVAVDGQGALLVADDVGNVIWRVTGSP